MILAGGVSASWYWPFGSDDDSAAPVCSWRSSANLLFSNWLNYFVYQESPYDIRAITPIQ